MPAPLRSLPPQTKKRKLAHTSSIVAEIKQLEDELSSAIKSNASLNKVADLLELVVGPALQPQELSKGIYSLYRVFTLVIASGKLSIQGEGAAKAVKTWLWERLNGYTDFLVLLMKDEEKVIRVSALQILFSLQKHLSSAQTAAATATDGASTSRPEFHLSHFRKVVSGLLLCPSRSGSSDGVIDADVLDTFYETWFSVYDDIRWFFLRESVGVLEKAPATASKNLLSILERLNTFPTDKEELNSWWVAELGAKPPKPKKTSANEDSEDDDEPTPNDEDEDDWRKFFDEPTPTDPKKAPSARLHKLTVHQSLHTLASHRAVFTRAWLSLLPRLSDANAAVRALNVMHRGVLPHLTRAVLVMDWIAGWVDVGGSVGLLALNGLFLMMRDYNLDYPSFYTRLYAFLDRQVLHLRHRARFFRMTEMFLSSSHLPATLLASFIKRLSRLSLNAPPAAIVMIVPFTYNILKKHPALMVMIHRDADSGFVDPFDPTEPNPLSTGALDSSLWELYSHRQHYHATVSTLCKVFAEAFTKPGYAMEDFLDHTYATLFDTEVNRKIKREPALAMEVGRSGWVEFFPSVVVEEDAGVQVDVVNELWVF
ncbi:hypothetical protein D9611_007264 [Ephemerocybe angulata]|uniref:CCAAT-binding factor domain-containing protein n=1 Tax=Ephemerocybe angulata TaxID=980116 RepID=A0A8H5B1I3_9AGAR|nr:hypothetical protein D9611_007264 [Tulosesus angulatus]